MDVGVRELKQKLSEYLDRAEKGELIRVTDRGRAKAILGPVPGKSRIDQGVAEGWIKEGTGGPLGACKPARARRSIREALREAVTVGGGARGAAAHSSRRPGPPARPWLDDVSLSNLEVLAWKAAGRQPTASPV